MENKINLGELAFTAEDFKISDDGVEWAKYGKARAIEMAYDANRILVEKLQRAPVVFNKPGIVGEWSHDWFIQPEQKELKRIAEGLLPSKD